MNIVLVLNKTTQKEVRVMVNVETHELKNRLAKLIEEDKGREAFDLLLNEAEVIDYLPQGSKLMHRADMILMEDLLY